MPETEQKPPIKKSNCNCNCGCDAPASGIYRQFCDSSTVCKRCYDNNHVFGFRNSDVRSR